MSSLPGALAAGSMLLVAACGSSSAQPSATASRTPPPATASATPTIIGSQRTVLSQLGLNIHASPATSSAVIATAAEGIVLTVQDYQAANGGWYKVQGSSTSGWIVADPTLTAMGAYQSYSSSDRGFSVLIPQTWTFAEEPADVLFRPQQGQQTIVVRTGANTAALGSEAPSGFVSSKSQQEIVCGYTGQLDFYVTGNAAPPASASPSGSASSAAQRLASYAAIRLRFDATHTMEIAINYATKDQLQVFEDFYNSISFPFPLCQAAAPSASAAPAT